ncbi:uncharacterized protein METZ01_LOCUS283718, partial [marine metagenome]
MVILVGEILQYFGSPAYLYFEGH